MSKIKKITLLAGCRRTGAVGRKGDTLEVPAELGDQLISQGAAFDASAPPPVRPGKPRENSALLSRLSAIESRLDALEGPAKKTPAKKTDSEE